ncbi:MAG: PHM/PNGase F domain-containing protein [Monoraphidium minutum]|nr:MAG: PHM/PNGase F domain-containing protein [Monoraphidium minutum]
MAQAAGRAPLALQLVLLLAVASGAAALGDCKSLQKGLKPAFKGCKVLKDGKAAVLWRLLKGGADLQLRLVVKAGADLGWMGLGFSDMGSMKGADFIIFHTSDSGAWTASDAHAITPGTPTKDAVQDVRFDSMEFDAGLGAWVGVAARKLKTCDLVNDIEIQGGRGFYALWAHGPRASNGFGGILKHPEDGRGFRAVEMLRLSSKQKAAARKIAASLKKKGPAAAAPLSEAAPPPLSEIATQLASELAAGRTMGPKCMAAACSSGAAASSLDFDGVATAAAVSEGGKTPEQMAYPVTKNSDGSYTADLKCGAAIPAVETTYMTCYLEVPTDQLYHITQYTTIMSHRLVHHSLIYACTKEYAEPLVDALFKAGTTGPFNQKDHNQICEAFYMVGPAPSDPTYVFPKVAGLPIGKGSYRYLAIEVHYNNPGLEVGQVDPGTGLTLTFEKKKRKHDIGLLTISQFVLDIAPGLDTAIGNRTVCHRECTKRFPKEVTIINQFVHMHGLGKAVTTQWLRGDEKTQRTAELEPMATVKGFDYAFQTWVDTPDQWKTIKPGDELSMTCTFDSTGRNTTSHWGFSTQDEMCFWWIYHYPAMPQQSICSSLGDLPVHLCMEEVSPLLDLKEASDAGNTTALANIILKLQKDGKAIIGSPAKPTQGLEWDPASGCSAALPQV